MSGSPLFVILPAHHVADVAAQLAAVLYKVFSDNSLQRNRTSSVGFFAQLSAINRACIDRKSTRLNSSHVRISYAVFCLKKKKKQLQPTIILIVTAESYI